MRQSVSTLPELLIRSYDAPASAPFSWLREMAATLREQMLMSGAVLVHGLPVDGPNSLARARDALGISGHVPNEAFNDRRDFGNGILGPINWPNDRVICPFQESSFSRTFPPVVLTACLTPPVGDGVAHLSDARRIAEHLPARLADRVLVAGWTLERTFHSGFGISWRDAFAVRDRDALGSVLEAAGIEAKWLHNGTLHTVRRLPGVITHPATGEQCWFNQISFLNMGSLDPSERAVLVRSFGKHLPMNTYYGDGSTLTDEDLFAIHKAYDSVKIGIPWRCGDLLVADNIMMAQGRSAYEGVPEFLVALGGTEYSDRTGCHRSSFDAPGHRQ